MLNIIKLLIAAIILGVIGFYLMPHLALDQVNVPSVFALGLLVGCMAGGLLMACLYRSAQKIVTLYVGNLPYKAGTSDIETLFSPYGTVYDARIVKDRRTGRSKGFGFVELDKAGAKAAMRELNGTEYAGRTLRINTANPEQ
ncbi:MAG: RNA recognition motif domain-containing protein [Mariprofundaceae bacterium]